MMNISSYLSRINYRDSTHPSVETLRNLQRAHLLTVPFENLSIHLGEPIILDEDLLFDKIVRRRRGGYCFELNGLFHRLLHELGFQVSLLNSFIPHTQGGCGMQYDHPILLVELEERWIVDVGFGDAYLLPLKLDETSEQTGIGVQYRLSANGDGRWNSYKSLESGEWELNYAFNLRPCHLSDFTEACRYYETSPDSSFTRKRMCTMASPDGHITLSEEHLAITRNKVVEEIPLNGEGDFVRKLDQYFGINLNERTA